MVLGLFEVELPQLLVCCLDLIDFADSLCLLQLLLRILDFLVDYDLRQRILGLCQLLDTLFDLRLYSYGVCSYDVYIVMAYIVMALAFASSSTHSLIFGCLTVVTPRMLPLFKALSIHACECGFRVSLIRGLTCCLVLWVSMIRLLQHKFAMLDQPLRLGQLEL